MMPRTPQICTCALITVVDCSLDLNSKLIIVCMLCQADLPCTANVSEIALKGLVNLLDCPLEVRVPLILHNIK